MPHDPSQLPYRPCVGVMLLNKQGLVWIGRRFDKANEEGSGHWWQMPQGGVDKGETPLEAACREHPPVGTRVTISVRPARAARRASPVSTPSGVCTTSADIMVMFRVLVIDECAWSLTAIRRRRTSPIAGAPAMGRGVRIIALCATASQRPDENPHRPPQVRLRPPP